MQQLEVSCAVRRIYKSLNTRWDIFVTFYSTIFLRGLVVN